MRESETQGLTCIFFAAVKEGMYVHTNTLFKSYVVLRFDFRTFTKYLSGGVWPKIHKINKLTYSLIPSKTASLAVKPLSVFGPLCKKIKPIISF